MIMDTISMPTLFEDLREIISSSHLSPDEISHIQYLLSNKFGNVHSLAEYEQNNH
jgi:hypothetical protein